MIWVQRKKEKDRVLTRTSLPRTMGRNSLKVTCWICAALIWRASWLPGCQGWGRWWPVTWKIVSSFQWGLILPSSTASLFTRWLIQHHLFFKCSQRSDLLCSRKKMVCIIVRIWGGGQIHISITVPVKIILQLDDKIGLHTMFSLHRASPPWKQKTPVSGLRQPSSGSSSWVNEHIIYQLFVCLSCIWWVIGLSALFFRMVVPSMAGGPSSSYSQT